MRSLHLIFNPAAGQGDVGQELETIQAQLASDFQLTTHLTTPQVGATDLTQKALNAGAEVVVAAGGDGTVSAAATALVNTAVPLGIVPRGTANSFAGALGLPGLIEEACQVVRQGQRRRVDVAECGDRVLLLLLSIGFEADLLTRLSPQDKQRFGRLALLGSGLQQWRHMSQFEAEIEAESGRSRRRATAITIANAAAKQSVLAQGPAQVVMDDGQLDMTLIAPASPWAAIASLWSLFLSALRRHPARHPAIHCQRDRAFRVITTPPQQVMADGENLGETPITVRCLPQALTVIAPPLQT